MEQTIIILGSGPAGLAAAIAARSRDKRALVIGNPVESSALAKAERVDNYPGMYGVNGLEMVKTMLAQTEEMGVEIKHGRVLNIMSMGGTIYLGIGSDMAEAKTVILATGVARAPFRLHCVFG